MLTALLPALSAAGTFVLIALGALLLFCIAVLVHEFGHFVAAKLLGFRVEAFSIGFGPVLWRKRARADGCEFRISALPLGGYVSLPQLDPSGVALIQGDGDSEVSLPRIAPWKRMIVALAGPFGNVVLAVVIAFAIYLMPPADKFGGIGTTVGALPAESAAAKAGLRSGDKIVSVMGTDVSFWTDITLETIYSGDLESGVQVEVEREEMGETRKLALTLPVSLDPDMNYQVLKDVSPRIPCRVSSFLPDSPAERAGVRIGDTIVAINGDVMNSPRDVVDKIASLGTAVMSVTLRRHGSGVQENIALAAVASPEASTPPMIGVGFSFDEISVPQWLRYRDPWSQIRNDADSVFRLLRALFAPQTKGEAGRAARGVGGAATLFVMLGLQVQAGLLHSIAFMRFLCINLAILNLLPLPVLDGGHTLFALYEMLFRRAPSQRFVSVVSNIFAMLLISLMAFLLFRDAFTLKKFFGADSASATPPVTEEVATSDGDAR